MSEIPWDNDLFGQSEAIPTNDPFGQSEAIPANDPWSTGNQAATTAPWPEVSDNAWPAFGDENKKDDPFSNSSDPFA